MDLDCERVEWVPGQLDLLDLPEAQPAADTNIGTEDEEEAA